MVTLQELRLTFILLQKQHKDIHYTTARVGVFQIALDRYHYSEHFNQFNCFKIFFLIYSVLEICQILIYFSFLSPNVINGGYMFTLHKSVELKI